MQSSRPCMDSFFAKYFRPVNFAILLPVCLRIVAVVSPFLMLFAIVLPGWCWKLVQVGVLFCIIC